MNTLAIRLMEKNPDTVPIIVQPHGDLQISKTKFLVYKETTISEFMLKIRKYVSVNKFEAIFLFVNNTLLPNRTTFQTAYDEHNNDGILYIQIRKEATFG